MRNIITFIPLVFITLAYSQNKFVFNENGLTPKYSLSNIDSTTVSELYTKTLYWIKKNYKNPEKVIDSKVKNDVIQFTGLKENAINTDKRYFNLNYTIKISFKKGQYTFEPLSIQTKANSKYDMGWKDFDLKNGSSFFKKGKAIKNTKSYVKVIPALLNDLNNSLYTFLITN